MKEIAMTILEQLGGNKFAAMTGAKNFTYSSTAKSPFLMFQIGSGAKNAIKFVKITLNSMDLYDMEFMKRNGSIVRTINGIYNDQLQDIFTDVTGFYTRLGR